MIERVLVLSAGVSLKEEGGENRKKDKEKNKERMFSSRGFGALVIEHSRAAVYCF